MMKHTLLILLTLSFYLPAFAADSLEERKVEGKDASFLASLMITSGVKKVAYTPSAASADHPDMKDFSESVYQMESIVCREKVCEAFKISPEKMKQLDALFRKLGVKETTPPVAKGQKKLKPFLYVANLRCGADSDPVAKTTCFVSAHFSPKAK